MPETEIRGRTVENGQFLNVPAYIENLADSFLLLVNTGEPRCIFSLRVFARLQTGSELHFGGSMNLPDGQEEVWYHSRVRVGSITKNHVPTVFREIPTYPSADGILGMNWFRLVEPKVKKITLDFETETLGLDFSQNVES